MNTLFIFLQTEAAAQPKGFNFTFLLMMLGIFVIMWFLMIRPQQKRQKELRKYQESIQKGDKVVTNFGVFGIVVEVKDETVLLEVDNNVKIRVVKSALVKDTSDIQR